ncbi:UNVERIFIED_CONTAM: hypothetical protein FKN15_004761 [Acipenser sinensis]
MSGRPRTSSFAEPPGVVVGVADGSAVAGGSGTGKAGVAQQATATSSGFGSFKLSRDSGKVTTVVATPGQGPDRPQEVSYTDIKVIGNGSFGVVYQARLVESREMVAIKKVLQDKRFKFLRRNDRPQEVSYTDIKVIGNGSFGVVYQARLVESREMVAIKKVLQDKRFKVFKPRTPPEAIALCSRLLEYTPVTRLSPLEACAHSFFDELRDPGTRLSNGRDLPHLFNFSAVGESPNAAPPSLPHPSITYPPPPCPHPSFSTSLPPCLTASPLQLQRSR